MNYVSSIDNKTFSSKEEALKHLEEKYLFQQEDTVVATIVNEIQKVIPSEFHIELRIDEDQVYSIVASNSDYSVDATLNCKEGVYCYGGTYNTLESVAEFFRWSTETVSKILNKVRETYDFKEFQFNRYHDDYGNGHYFEFSYVTHEDTHHRITYECGDIEVFAEQFKQHFVDSLEGMYARLEDEGYFIDYGIDGIPIGGVLERAKKLNKKVKLEIIN